MKRPVGIMLIRSEVWHFIFQFSAIFSQNKKQLVNFMINIILLTPVKLIPIHYKNTPIQIYRKFHFQKLNIFR